MTTASIDPAAPARTILVVDDDRAVAGTFARILELEGFAVKTVSTEEATTHSQSETRPDAILLDMGVPATGGLELLRMLRSRPPFADVPVAIVTSDYFIAHSLQRELEHLSVAIKYKPLYFEDLVALARKLVSSAA